MFLKLMLLVPLLRQSMLLEEFCELGDGPVLTDSTVDGVDKAARAAAARVDWRSTWVVNTTAIITVRFWRFHKQIGVPVYTFNVAHGGGTYRYYLTRRGRLYQGSLHAELQPVSLSDMPSISRSQLRSALEDIG